MFLYHWPFHPSLAQFNIINPSPWTFFNQLPWTRQNQILICHIYSYAQRISKVEGIPDLKTRQFVGANREDQVTRGGNLEKLKFRFNGNSTIPIALSSIQSFLRCLLPSIHCHTRHLDVTNNDNPKQSRTVEPTAQQWKATKSATPMHSAYYIIWNGQSTGWAAW